MKHGDVPFAARLAAVNATEEEFIELENIMKESKPLLNKADRESEEKLIALNSQFHDMIAGISRNPRLELQFTQLRTLTYFYRAHNAKGAGRRNQIYLERYGIHEAIRLRKTEESAFLIKTLFALIVAFRTIFATVFLIGVRALFKSPSWSEVALGSDNFLGFHLKVVLSRLWVGQLFEMSPESCLKSPWVRTTFRGFT